MLHKRLADINTSLYSDEGEHVIHERLRQEIAEMQFIINNKKEKFDQEAALLLELKAKVEKETQEQHEKF